MDAAERAETRKNSTLAREVGLALPSLLTPEERQAITERFAQELVDRYNVAVSVAIHSPGKGDEHHAHILFTTREMDPDGLGKKTRVLDDRTTGPQEVVKLRELAADLINESLKAVNADIRVDHRSFKERGVDRQPTTHLGPAASEMERRGEPTERGDMNRQAEHSNALTQERGALDTAIENERERISSPPQERDDARERVREAATPFATAIASRGTVPDIQSDGIKWWQRTALTVAKKARDMVLALASKAKELWQEKITREPSDRERGDTGGLER